MRTAPLKNARPTVHANSWRQTRACERIGSCETAMPARKPISKKVRFEVFKRDCFKCQYCGAEAPNVLLHVDHIKPVAEGGTNELMNLITACAACNAGKAAVPLSDHSALAKHKAQLDE